MKISSSIHPPIPLVFFGGKFHPEILRGSPKAGASNKRGVGKISSFLYLSVNTSKTVADDTAKVTIKGRNRKSRMSFTLTPRSMTLDDLELL